MDKVSTLMARQNLLSRLRYWGPCVRVYNAATETKVHMKRTKTNEDME